MRHTFRAEQWLPYPVELVFAFFANPQNLPPLMPKWQKARIEEAVFTTPPPRPATPGPQLRLRGIAAGAGTKMTISFRPFPFSPVRVPWEAEITEFVWNDHFCDTQLRGPFAYWHHCHFVQADAREGISGTMLRDELEYEMHLGALGELANKIAGRSQIQKIFAYRQQRTIELFRMITPAA